jgi:hypothetical protein
MKKILIPLCLAGAFCSTAGAGSVTYNTNGSTLSCNGVAGCVQDSTTSVTIGGVTLDYNPDAGSTINPVGTSAGNASVVGYGNFQTTALDGAAGGSFVGVQFTLAVNDSSPIGSGSFLPETIGGFGSGVIAPGQSLAFISFATAGTATVGTGANAFTYSVDPGQIFLDAPGNGLSTVSGSVYASPTAVPPPASAWLLISALGCLAWMMRRKANGLSVSGTLAA